ncbi:MAG: adenylate kinase family protein [Candidatus Helarchaeota archaeon]
MEKNIEIILVSGTPGTGKSTMAEYLSKYNHWALFQLGDFILENKLYIGEDKGRNTKIIDDEKASIMAVIKIFDIIKSFSVKNNKSQQLDNKVEKLDKQLIILVESHYSDIIIDGIEYIKKNNKNNQILRNIPNSLIDSIKKFNIKESILAIILRCEPFELEKRLKARRYPLEKVKENVLSEILSQCTNCMLEVLDKKNVFEIDTTSRTVEKVATIARNIILGNTQTIEKYRVGKINWLKEIGKSSKYDVFFT